MTIGVSGLGDSVAYSFFYERGRVNAAIESVEFGYKSHNNNS